MLGNNVFQNVAGYQQQAGDFMSNVLQGGAGSAYQDVIDMGLADIERQRKMAQNQLDAQVPTGAFGGSRQAVAQSLANERYDTMARDFAAQQRLADYNQRMNAARNLQSLGNQMFGQGRFGLQMQEGYANRADQQTQAALDEARRQALTNMGYGELASTIGLFGQLPGVNRNQVNIPEQLGLVDYFNAFGQLGSIFSGGLFG